MTASETWRHELWRGIGQGLAAHAVMLRDVSILDDASAGTLLTAVDSVRRGDPPPVNGSLALVAAFDERFDSLTAAGAAGAGSIGRARHDLAATAQRLALRERALTLIDHQLAARAALLDLAESHVFTLMPAWSGNAVLQPTNLAHFLTGTIAPLERAGRWLRAIYEEIDRSPLGAAALAGPGLPIDRDETSDLLGCEGPVESTIDALAAIDHLIAAGNAAALAVQPLRRLIAEILHWLRAEPLAIRLDEELLAPPDPSLPHFRPPVALERLVADARSVEALAQAIRSSASEAPYGPTGELMDTAMETSGRALAEAANVSGAFATMISGPIEFNRAWLARTAGRALVTSGELGDFLMAEEGLDPASARNIATITAHRAQQEGLEASGITPALLDSAAMLVIGRELGIEIERLGAYLAPRRFVEKRTLLGGPAAPAVREFLGQNRERLARDRRWLAETRRRHALAEENLEIRSREILQAATSG